MTSFLRGSAFITGAASGIGKQTALAFAKYGITRLALADINGQALKVSQSELKRQFPKVELLPLNLDVRNKDEVTGGVLQTVKRFGRLDVAVNNAGINGSGLLTHLTPDEEIEKVLDVNLYGVYRCQKAQLSVMVKQEDLGPREGRGRIINVASMYGLVAPNRKLSHTAYTVAKHGVIGLTRGDANAYADYNIRINAISPGYVATPLIEASMETSKGSPLDLDVSRTPLQRLCTMDEIADSIACLASPMNSFMQGSVTVVDGGFTSN